MDQIRLPWEVRGERGDLSLNIQMAVEKGCPSPPKKGGGMGESKDGGECRNRWSQIPGQFWLSRAVGTWKERVGKKVRKVDEGPIMMSPWQTEEFEFYS